MDLRQTNEWAGYLKKMGWKSEKSERSDKSESQIIGYIRKIPLTTCSILKIQRVDSKSLDLKWVENLEKKYRVIITYIESNESMEIPGYRKTWNGMLPTKTRIVDLRIRNQDLLGQMKAKTRYNIKKAISEQFAVNSNTVLSDNLVMLLQGNAWRVGLMGMGMNGLRAEDEAFKEKAFTIEVSQNNQLLAGAIFLCTDNTAYYLQNGSTAAGRKYMAPTLVVWEGILEARRRGLKYFDFDGVSDERHPTKKWSGFTRFKEGFGGKPIYYPQALVKYRWPF
jgi:hypothetical protein